MILGNQECDEETAYFLMHGKLKPYKRPNCQYGLSENDIDYHLHESRPDEYYCWQGTRIPCWFE
jgi:hypothetical protein